MTGLGVVQSTRVSPWMATLNRIQALPARDDFSGEEVVGFSTDVSNCPRQWFSNTPQSRSTGLYLLW